MVGKSIGGPKDSMYGMEISKLFKMGYSLNDINFVLGRIYFNNMLWKMKH